MARIALAILLIVFGSICMGFVGFQDCKSKKKSSNNWLLLGIICLIAGLIFFYFGSCKSEMRRRLNEPIVSEAQLYGYQITNKRWVRKKTPDDEPFSIDIKDILPFSRGILRNVEVSEEIYNKVEKGKCYLPESEPNEPRPLEPNEPVNQKTGTNVSAFFISKINVVTSSSLRIQRIELNGRRSHIRYHTNQGL